MKLKTDYTESMGIVTIDYSEEIEEIKALFAQSMELESKLVTLNNALGSNRIYTSNKLITECISVIS